MKRTKSMFYNPTAESNDLYLYATNEYRLYNQIESVIANLEKKIAKGIYDSDKAIDIWFYVAENAARLYFKNWGYKMTVNERFNAAIELKNDYEIDRNI